MAWHGLAMGINVWTAAAAVAGQKELLITVAHCDVGARESPARLRYPQRSLKSLPSCSSIGPVHSKTRCSSQT